MALDERLIEGMLDLADSDRAKQLTAQLVLCESLRDWLEVSKEGQMLNKYIMDDYDMAIKAFEDCELSDTKALQEAKMQVMAIKKIYNIFNQVFSDSKAAEDELTGAD